MSATADRAGSVVIVTGAAGGIGTATVEQLAARGATVVAADVSEAVEELAGQLGDRVHAERVDVSDEPQVEALIANTVGRCGRLDAIFNNAGIMGPVTAIDEYPSDSFDAVIRINLRGVFYGIKHAVPALRASGGGRILNTASTGAVAGGPGMAAYIAAKHGVLGLTRTTGLDYAKQGIICNAICPGATDTKMMASFLDGHSGGDPAAREQVLASVSPVGRMAEPRELAEVATFLLLDAPLFMTGSPVLVDGGITAGH